MPVGQGVCVGRGWGWREGRRGGIKKERRQSLQKIQIKNGEYVLKKKGLGGSLKKYRYEGRSLILFF